MALLFVGKTQCPVCCEIIKSVHDAIGLPPFVFNPSSPLFKLSDSSLHKKCYQKLLSTPKVGQVLNLLSDFHKPENRICQVCDEQILEPEDYIGWAYLADEDSPLYQFNFQHFHRDHIKEWSRLEEFLFSLRKLDVDGKHPLKRLMNHVNSLV